MTFLEALKTGRPIRQASWVDGLWLSWSWAISMWVPHSDDGRELGTFINGRQMMLTPSSMLADDWEAAP